jgi:glycosyltransferase involved in cell wall biosynthesis
MDSSRMKIGFDISQTGGSKAGCGFYADAMIRALVRLHPEDEYVLYPSFGNFFFDATMPLTCPVGGARVGYGPRHMTRDRAADYWTDPALQQRIGPLDLVHANNFWCPLELTQSRLVYTLYDVGFLDQPWWTTEANRVGCFEGIFKAALHADWIVAISKASRDHFLQIFPSFPRDRIVVIHPCSRFVAPLPDGSPPAALRNVAPGGFWLNVGTVEPRKNQSRLAKAYAGYLAAGGRPMPLVLAGGKGWLMDDFQAEIAQLGISQHVLFTGYVSDDELMWLYKNCYCNVYPSLFEGFGLPVLEGMQAAAPTIASCTTSVPEVTGDAAILVDPYDVDSITAAMMKVGADAGLRDKLSQAAAQRAAVFRWDDSAQQLHDLYRTAIAAPKRVAVPARLLPEAA